MKTTNCPNCGAGLANKTAKCTYCNTTLESTANYVAKPVRVERYNPAWREEKYHYAKYFGASFALLVLSFLLAGVGKTNDSNVFLFALIIFASVAFFLGGIISLVYMFYKKATED